MSCPLPTHSSISVAIFTPIYLCISAICASRIIALDPVTSPHFPPSFPRISLPLSPTSPNLFPTVSQTAVERHSGDLLHRALTAGSLRDKRVLVYGSTHPELEARVLTLGAASVDSVLPIAGVRRPHPRLQLLSGAVWRETSLRSTKQYDAAVVGPKLWRSGLGMAGPGWYPWGDVTAVAQVCYGGAAVYMREGGGRACVSHQNP